MRESINVKANRVIDLYWDKFPKFHSCKCSDAEYIYRNNEVSNLLLKFFSIRELLCCNWIYLGVAKRGIKFLREYQTLLQIEMRFEDLKVREFESIEKEIKKIEEGINKYIEEANKNE